MKVQELLPPVKSAFSRLVTVNVVSPSEEQPASPRIAVEEEKSQVPPKVKPLGNSTVMLLAASAIS